jgi:hypothetical protein
MKIIVIIPDGVVVRNYLYTNFVKELTQNGFDIYVFHQIPKPAVDEIKLATNTIKEFHFIPFFTEPALARTIREIVVYARLLYNSKAMQNDTIMCFWNNKKKGFKRKILANLSESVGYLLSKSYKTIVFLEKKYDQLMTKTSVYDQVREKIKAINPDIVLNLHQRSIVSSPIINFCNANNITSATVIYSWDNVPKARIISRYDYYFTWSNLMKSELLKLYPEIKEYQAKVTGTPQFEFYFNDHYKVSKEEFFKQHHLDITKKTLCFSSNDTSSPHEVDYFVDVCEAIEQMNPEHQPQIIFRRNPFDKSNRFANVLEHYKHLVTCVEPDWRTENPDDKDFVTIYPSINDIQLLVNTVLHSDAVINLASTMAHDFAVLNKPCLYLSYDPVNTSRFPVKDIYDFQHFRSMKNLDAVVWINSKSELSNKIGLALSQPDTFAKEKNKWMEIIVQHPLDKNSANLANEIKKICTSV